MEAKSKQGIAGGVGGGGKSESSFRQILKAYLSIMSGKYAKLCNLRARCALRRRAAAYGKATRRVENVATGTPVDIGLK